MSKGRMLVIAGLVATAGLFAQGARADAVGFAKVKGVRVNESGTLWIYLEAKKCTSVNPQLDYVYVPAGHANKQAVLSAALSAQLSGREAWIDTNADCSVKVFTLY